VRVVTVLQSRALHALHPNSSEFKASHVLALKRQIEKWAPFASFECLTDLKIPYVDCQPLENNWPGWWAKMNLFSPKMKGDFLFMDLDTVILGPLDDIARVNKLTMLRDFYRDGKKYKEGLGGGLMYLTEESREEPWRYFSSHPASYMRTYVRGEQHLLENYYLKSAQRWQDVVPGQVVSHKVHCQNGVPPDARIVCFHGKPRPFEVGLYLHLYR
jgi:hypothetical protein